MFFRPKTLVRKAENGKLVTAAAVFPLSVVMGWSFLRKSADMRLAVFGLYTQYVVASGDVGDIQNC